jgi:hypothetical protein
MVASRPAPREKMLSWQPRGGRVLWKGARPGYPLPAIAMGRPGEGEAGEMAPFPLHLQGVEDQRRKREPTPAALNNHQAFGSSKLCLEGGCQGKKEPVLAGSRAGGCDGEGENLFDSCWAGKKAMIERKASTQMQQVEEESMRPLFCAILTAGFWVTASAVCAIEIHPQAADITMALERGSLAAVARTPPERLYTWFGTERRDGVPHGFLVTKLDALAVLSAHFSLRSLSPSPSDQAQVLADPFLLVSVILFGERPDFAVDSYILLQQGSRKIIPTRVRFDATATRSSAWPSSPAYRAKVVAFFAYADFDPGAESRISVFPRGGGEIGFDLDFAAIP